MLWRLLEAGKDVLKTPARDVEDGLLAWDLPGGRGSEVCDNGKRSPTESWLLVFSPLTASEGSTFGPRHSL